MSSSVNSRVFRWGIFNKKEDYYLNSGDYYNIVNQEKLLVDFIDRFFFKNSVLEVGFILHTVKVSRKNSQSREFDIKIYLYDTNFEEYLKELQLRRGNNAVNLSKLLSDASSQPSFKSTLRLLEYRLLYLEKVLLQEVFKFLKSKVSITFYGVRDVDLTSKYLVRYICMKLKQGYSLNEVLVEVERGLRLSGFVKGYRIGCYGRFDKKTRAHVNVKNYGRVPFSSIGQEVDFAMEEVILKFGLCNIKVWLYLDKVNLKDYSYKYNI